MNTQPDNLPFIKEPEYDYILTADDRVRFAPKLATDEFWHPGVKLWYVCKIISQTDFANAIHYRRRKSSGWVSVKERLPEANVSIYVCQNDSVTPISGGYSDPANIFKGYKITHWMPWTLPALPQPPKPAAEVACKEWMKTLTEPMSIERAFLAGSEWAKDHKEAL